VKNLVYPAIFYFFAITKIDGNNISLPKAEPDAATFATGWRLLAWAMTGIAVIFVAIGGFKYVKSNGEPGEISKAKNTIIYALVGLVVSLSAQALVSVAINETTK
jgi:Type IV secretion system pilin